MKKEYIIGDLYYKEAGLDFSDYEDVMSYSVRYKVDGDSDISDPNAWYIMGVDVAEEPESIKRQKERDKKIDSILN